MRDYRRRITSIIDTVCLLYYFKNENFKFDFNACCRLSLLCHCDVKIHIIQTASDNFVFIFSIVGK